MNDIKEYDEHLGGEWTNLTLEQKLWLIHRAEVAVEDLKGTCLASYEVVVPMEDDFIAHYGQHDIRDMFEDLLEFQCHVQELVLCECCNWWVPAHEITSNNYCTDCDGDNEDE